MIRRDRVGAVGADANRAVVERLWAAFDARDWKRAASALDDDVVCEWPHSGERFLGRDVVIAINRDHPDPWIRIELLRVVAEGDEVVTEVRVPVAGAPPAYVASFFELRNGLIVRMREYWVDAGSQQPYPSRAGLSDPPA
jgi:ketosteroid isomerase-like protein